MKLADALSESGSNESQALFPFFFFSPSLFVLYFAGLVYEVAACLVITITIIPLIITSVILIGLIIPPFIIIIIAIIIISIIRADERARYRAVIGFAFAGCSLIKRPRTAAASPDVYVWNARVWRKKEKKKKRAGKKAASPLPLLLLPACFNGFIKAPGPGRIKK